MTGASPVVDVQNVRTQNVLSRETLDTLPTGKTVTGFAALTLGAIEVSGGAGCRRQSRVRAPGSLMIHGGRNVDQRGPSGRHALSTTQPAPAAASTSSSSRIRCRHRKSRSRRAACPPKARPPASRSTSCRRTAATRSRAHSSRPTAARSCRAAILTDELRARGLTRRPRAKRSTTTGSGMAARSNATIVVLRGAPVVGRAGVCARELLQQDAGHPVLYAGSEPAGLPGRP